MNSKDYYQSLGISRGVGLREIKSAYRKLALEYHPDRNPNNPNAEEKFKEINEAYQVLSNKSKRAQYDEQYAWYEQRQADAQPGGSSASQGFQRAARREPTVTKRQAVLFAVEELSKYRDRSELVMAICDMMGMEWAQAEEFIKEVETKYLYSIAIRQSPIIVRVGVATIILGGLMLVFAFALLIYEIANPFIVMIPYAFNFVVILASTGIGMLGGGIMGIQKARSTVNMGGR